MGLHAPKCPWRIDGEECDCAAGPTVFQRIALAQRLDQYARGALGADLAASTSLALEESVLDLADKLAPGSKPVQHALMGSFGFRYVHEWGTWDEAPPPEFMTQVKHLMQKAGK